MGKAGEEVVKVDEEAGGSAKMSLDRIEVWLLVEEGRSAGAAARRGKYIYIKVAYSRCPVREKALSRDRHGLVGSASRAKEDGNEAQHFSVGLHRRYGT